MDGEVTVHETVAVSLDDIVFMSDGPLRTNAIGALYAQLARRPAYANISHAKMPIFTEHWDFVKAIPYLSWWLIRPRNTKEWVGNIYVTKQYEVGLFIDEEFRGEGYGSAAMTVVEGIYSTRHLLANIAPGNERSKEFFQKRGYSLIQNTYRKSPT